MIKDTINVFKNGNKEEAVKIIQRRRAENKRLEEDTERLFDNMGKDEKSKSSYTDMVFFDIISCYQRVYSHCSNIAKLFGTDKEYVYTKNEEEHFASLRNRY
jgi:phosphate uptake regulator